MESVLFIFHHHKLCEHVAAPAATKALCVVSHRAALLLSSPALQDEAQQQWKAEFVSGLLGKIEPRVGNKAKDVR